LERGGWRVGRREVKREMEKWIERVGCKEVGEERWR
jgi:hypothetical protein